MTTTRLEPNYNVKTKRNQGKSYKYEIGFDTITEERIDESEMETRSILEKEYLEMETHAQNGFQEFSADKQLQTLEDKTTRVIGIVRQAGLREKVQNDLIVEARKLVQQAYSKHMKPSAREQLPDWKNFIKQLR
jgi:hypothetical protein